MSEAREPSAGTSFGEDLADGRTAGPPAEQPSTLSGGGGGEQDWPVSDAREPSAGVDTDSSWRSDGGESGGGAGGVAVESFELEGEIAADYVEGLLDVIDYDGDIDMDVEGDRAIVSVLGISGRELVGQRGEVLEALQDLTRLAVHQKTGVRSRLMLDIGGYRARRRDELTELGREISEQVRRTGQERSLEPMTPFERKVVHDAVAAAGLRSESEGEEPERYVIVLPGMSDD